MAENKDKLASQVANNQGQNWRGKMTKKPAKVPDVKLSAMGTTDISLDFSFIIYLGSIDRDFIGLFFYYIVKSMG